MHRPHNVLLCITWLSVFAMGCDDTPTPTPTPPFERLVADIGEEGGTLEDPGGRVRLEVPVGSITEDIEVSIEEASPPGDTDSVMPGTVYEFKPEGVTFDPPLKVEIAYDEDALPAGVDESTLAIHVWEDGKWVIEKDARVDTVNNVLSASLEHFSVRAARVVEGSGPTPDAGMPDIGMPDIGMPDVGVPDVGVPDVGMPDGGMPDVGMPDVGMPDMGPPDAGPDADGDGAPDSTDNCPDLPNADQADGDGDGVGDACARSIFIELTWEAGNLSDLNLYYLHENATSWTDPMWALYWSFNMRDWEGAPGDPSYTIDQTQGPGPEQVVHREAGDRVHYIGVDNYNSRGFPPATATVRVFLRGERTPSFEASRLVADGQFWAVARIEPGPGAVIALMDQDEDGIPDDWDNCPITPNFDQADGDGDGVGDACPGVQGCQSNADCQALEICVATRCTLDTDGDGTPDSDDVCPMVSDPNQLDSDSDGLGDLCDNCPNDANPGQENGDGDSHPDACDNCPIEDNENQLDTDSDGVGDVCENCPDVANPDQRNFDRDLFGDACDTCPLVVDNTNADSDGDGIGDLCVGEQTCQMDTDCTSPEVCLGTRCVLDTDGDNVPDAVDICPMDPNGAQRDGDGDGVGDDCDTCPFIADPNQDDGDGDGVGDACPGALVCQSDADCVAPEICTFGRCILDDDQDDWPNDMDNCPMETNPGQFDVDGDDVGDLCDNCEQVPNTDQLNQDGDDEGDACDPDIDGDGVDNLLDNCPVDINPNQEDGDSDGVGDACAMP